MWYAWGITWLAIATVAGLVVGLARRDWHVGAFAFLIVWGFALTVAVGVVAFGLTCPPITYLIGECER